MSDHSSLLFIDQNPADGSSDLFWASVVTEVWSVNERVGLPWKGYISGCAQAITVSDPKPPRTIGIGTPADLADRPTPIEAIMEEIENRIKVRLSPPPPRLSSPFFISGSPSRRTYLVAGTLHFSDSCLAGLPHFEGWVFEREKMGLTVKRYMEMVGTNVLYPASPLYEDALFKLALQRRVSPGLTLAAETTIDSRRVRGALIVGAEKTQNNTFEAVFYIEGNHPYFQGVLPSSFSLSRKLYTGPRSRRDSNSEIIIGKVFADLQLEPGQRNWESVMQP